MNDHSRKALRSAMQIEPESLAASLEERIRQGVEEMEREGAILGLSGGVDSAVVAALCARALGPGRVLALLMPEKDSRKEHQDDAHAIAGELGISVRMIELTGHLERLGVYELLPLRRLPMTEGLRGALMRKAYGLYDRRTGETPFSASLLGFREKEFGPQLRRGNAYYRIKHRLRMLFLYYHGEIENRLVVGAANKSEYMIGFFVKHGCDDAADMMPLLTLYKTQVRELARHLGIPPRIIEKPPSPDLLPGVTDEQAIGISYEELDEILLAIERGWTVDQIVHATLVPEERVAYVERLIERSGHMRSGPIS
jgi:NAD+ synthase